MNDPTYELRKEMHARGLLALFKLRVLRTMLERELQRSGQLRPEPTCTVRPAYKALLPASIP